VPRGSEAKKQVAFRVQPRTLAHLKRRVNETGLSQTDLAERYLEEGLRLDEHPLIAFRDGAAGRRPGLVGSRLDVWQIVETVKQNGSVEEAAAYLELPIDKVQAAMRYYADYTDEIDEWTARAHALAEREHANWRRQQELAG
jgi:uncharacterized protein (DUF433 family)